MLHRSGWAFWRRAGRGKVRNRLGHDRPAATRLVRHPKMATDADRARVRFERTQFAARIDRELRVVSRTEAAARRELGCAAHLLLQNHLYRRLGFVRLCDYARERLGLSARTLQSAAWVATRLDALPAVSTAFDRSEISWTQARMVCAVASAADEERWLAVARRCTVEQLADVVKRAQPPRGVPADPESESNAIDGEPAVRWCLSCPARVRALWRYALELASRVAGGPLAEWHAAEIIAAEGSSGRPAGASLGERAVAVLQRATALGEPPTASPLVPPRWDAVLSLGDSLAAIMRADVFATPNEAFARSADAFATPGEAFATPADAFALDARLIAARRAIQTSDARIGRLLRVVVDHHFYRLLGFFSVDVYVRERLGISARKAWALLKLEKATVRSGDFARAYADGSLSWTRALCLLPVLERGNAEAWIARAQTVTVRRLCDEVNHVLEARDALGRGVTLDPPPADSVLASPIAALVEAGCRDLSLPCGVQIGAHDVVAQTDGRVGAVQIGAHDAPEMDVGRRGHSEVCDASVSFTGPASVVALLRDVMDAFALPEAPRWVAFERLLRHVIAHWERTPRHRDPIFARDGWRCRVPACSSRRNLHDHHVVYRSRGGGNERANRVAVCAAHHLHGIHPGVIQAWGLAPHDIHWELGVRWGAPPLLTYVGDRVCAPESTHQRYAHA